MQTNTPTLVFVTETGNEEIHYSHAQVSKKHQTFKQFLPISMKLFQIIYIAYTYRYRTSCYQQLCSIRSGI